jgi:gas vesicle protein
MGKEQSEGGSNIRKMAGIAAFSAAAGAVAAAMFTPKSGRDLRSSLRGKARDVKDKAKGKIEEAKDKR